MASTCYIFGFDGSFKEESNDLGRGNTHTHIVHVSVNRWQQSLFSLVVLVTKIPYFIKSWSFRAKFVVRTVQNCRCVLVVHDKKYEQSEIEIHRS